MVTSNIAHVWSGAHIAWIEHHRQELRRAPTRRSELVTFRRIPPVHSPIRPIAALRAAVAPPADAPARLRRLLADRYDADSVVLTDSGTHALQVALAHLVDMSGVDAVALPAYTCYDVATAGAGAASRLEFYDIDPDTFEPDPASFESALAAGVAAVVVVHHFGIPVDLEPLAAQAAAHGAVVVEDAAQAHGGFLRGRPLGSLAPYSVLSFGRGKGWTGGGGGALLLRGAAEKSAHPEAQLEGRPGPGRAAAAVKLIAQWLLARPSLYGLPARLPFLGLGETVYHPPTPAAPMSAGAAHAVLATDRAALAEAEERKVRAEQIRAALASTELRLPPEAPTAGWLRMPLRVPGRSAAEVLDERARSLGVLPGYPRALPTLPEIAELRGTSRSWEGAETLAKELFTVPTHSISAPERVVEALASVAE